MKRAAGHDLVKARQQRVLPVHAREQDVELGPRAASPRSNRRKAEFSRSGKARSSAICAAVRRPGEALHHGAFKPAADPEDIAALIERGIGDESAPVRQEVDQAFYGEPTEGFAAIVRLVPNTSRSHLRQFRAGWSCCSMIACRNASCSSACAGRRDSRARTLLGPSGRLAGESRSSTTLEGLAVAGGFLAMAGLMPCVDRPRLPARRGLIRTRACSAGIGAPRPVRRIHRSEAGNRSGGAHFAPNPVEGLAGLFERSGLVKLAMPTMSSLATQSEQGSQEV